MTKQFEILLLGNPMLRRVAETIHTIDSHEHQQLFSDLMQFVLERKGMGIAATQVDITKRFFIMSSHPNSRYPHAPNMNPTVIINPEVISVSDSMNKDWEGCLSVPGVRALVPRHDEISVRYFLTDGTLVETEYSGFIARVFQHENDHLDGLVFLDRIETPRDIMVEAQWQRHIADIAN